MAIKYEEERLARARAVLREASDRVGVRPAAPTVELDIPETAVARAAIREAAVTGQAFAKGREPPKSEEVLSPPVLVSRLETDKPGFDRAAYQRAYMKAWRARRKATSA